MIFADKLIQLRKKSGWSQEELAEQMHVTRQSVSKWEGAQAIPELEKLIRLSELFSVSIDSLLKDEMEIDGGAAPAQDVSPCRRVTMAEANAFLSATAATAKPIAIAVLLCILSPVCLFLLAAFSEVPAYGLTENAACGIGMVVLLVLVAIAVVLFISCGHKTAPFAYLEKESFEAEYGVSGMAKDRREQYKSSHAKHNVTGVCICIASCIPLFCTALFDAANELLLVPMLCATMALAGIGAALLVHNGILWASFEKLLQDGDYAKAKKEKRALLAPASTAYWLLATAVFLTYSFITDDWEHSWIVWPIAGVLYPVLLALLNIAYRKK